jgi:hypothetical protein
VLATLLGGLALATSAALAGSPAGGSLGVPASTVTTFGADSAHYCVTHYAPNAAVAVHNEKTGKSATIHTNHKGRGCTDVPVEVTCGQQVTQLIVASGVGADGSPGTSSAQAKVPGNLGKCAGSAAGTGDSGGGTSSSLSTTAKTLIAVGGAAVLAIGAVAIVLVRRRRSPAVTPPAE